MAICHAARATARTRFHAIRHQFHRCAAMSTAVVPSHVSDAAGVLQEYLDFGQFDLPTATHRARHEKNNAPLTPPSPPNLGPFLVSPLPPELTARSHTLNVLPYQTSSAYTVGRTFAAGLSYWCLSTVPRPTPASPTQRSRGPSEPRGHVEGKVACSPSSLASTRLPCAQVTLGRVTLSASSVRSGTCPPTQFHVAPAQRHPQPCSTT